MLTRWIERGSRFFVGILVAAMTAVVLLQVVARYILKIPLFWTEELGRYLMIWAGMLGAALAISYGLHASIEMVANLFPPRFKAVLGMLTRLFMLAFAVFTIVASINLMQFLRFQISPAMRISMIYPYSAVPVGCAIMIPFILSRLFRDIKNIVQGSSSPERS
jgi:TRAP-type transport system small permease protein